MLGDADDWLCSWNDVGPRQHRRLILLIYADYSLAGAARQEADASGAGSFYNRGCRCCVLPGPHNAVERARTSHLGATRRTIAIMSVRGHGFDLAGDRPQEADELAGDRHDRDLRPLAIREMVETGVQPLLRLPGAYFGEADHSFRTKAITRFGPSRSLISVQGDHLFRSMPIIG